jgi:hypothetical protein
MGVRLDRKTVGGGMEGRSGGKKEDKERERGEKGGER